MKHKFYFVETGDESAIFINKWIRTSGFNETSANHECFLLLEEARPIPIPLDLKHMVKELPGMPPPDDEWQNCLTRATKIFIDTIKDFYSTIEVRFVLVDPLRARKPEYLGELLTPFQTEGDTNYFLVPGDAPNPQELAYLSGEGSTYFAGGVFALDGMLGTDVRDWSVLGVMLWVFDDVDPAFVMPRPKKHPTLPIVNLSDWPRTDGPHKS